MQRTKVVDISEEETILSRKTRKMKLDYDYFQMYVNVYNRLENCSSTWTLRFAMWLIGRIGCLPAGESKVRFGMITVNEFRNERLNKNLDAPSERTLADIVSELMNVGIIRRWAKGNYEISTDIFRQGVQIQDDSESGEPIEAGSIGAADS